MVTRKRTFPLIADDEAAISPPRQMKLYDTKELITNGGGHFQVITDPIQTPFQESFAPKTEPMAQSKSVTSYSEQAKQEAREDLRRKRQAIVKAEQTVGIKVPDLPASPQKNVQSQGLGKYSDKLRQSSYILADIKPIYKEPEKKSDQKAKKNNYDFLKRSQVYNKQENQTKKERQVAQELNLTRFEDLN